MESPTSGEDSAIPPEGDRAEGQAPVQTPGQPCRLPLQGERLGAAPLTWAGWSRAWAGPRLQAKLSGNCLKLGEMAGNTLLSILPLMSHQSEMIYQQSFVFCFFLLKYFLPWFPIGCLFPGG